MFSIEQIKEAYAKVETGADFPAYVQELIDLGIKYYETYLSDGHNVYFGKDGFHTSSESSYEALEVAAKCDETKFRHYLNIHQQGETDFPTFCRDAAAAGIYKWTVDFEKLTCVYFDKSGNEIFAEKILQM